MALRDYTLQNFMIWSVGGLLAMTGAGIGAAQWLRPLAPATVVAEVVPVEARPIVREPTPVLAAQTELPRLHPPAAKARPAPRLPTPPHPVPQPARARVPAPSIAPPPIYTPSAQWRQTYVAAPYLGPYYGYVPRYRGYAGYPGY